MRVTIAEIAQALGYPYHISTENYITGLAIDSRTVKQGDLFSQVVMCMVALPTLGTLALWELN